MGCPVSGCFNLSEEKPGISYAVVRQQLAGYCTPGGGAGSRRSGKVGPEQPAAREAWRDTPEVIGPIIILKLSRSVRQSRPGGPCHGGAGRAAPLGPLGPPLCARTAGSRFGLDDGDVSYLQHARSRFHALAGAGVPTSRAYLQIHSPRQKGCICRGKG